ncbi:MAG: Transcriptional regulator, LysR family [Polyangiaceae bacterium]|nr:Transcriptional regulator, LysR family [Polyangiaceae bacterium]
MDLNLLVVLHTVLAERNVARAAARLHVTPSAVSNALARLRDLLQDPLFTRHGRGIAPTPRALELEPVLAAAFSELERAVVSAPFDAASCARTFTLAVADVGQVVWVPRLAKAMQAELPCATLRVVSIDSLVSLGDLSSPEVDVHVGVAGRGPGLHVEPLRQEPSVLVARAGHPTPRRKLTAAALSALRHVRVEMVPGKNYADPFAAVFARAKATRVVALSVPSFSAAAEVVAQTDLVSMLPAPIFAAKAEALGLRALVTPLPAHRTRFSLSWHQRTHTDPAARAFRELVRSAVCAA